MDNTEALRTTEAILGDRAVWGRVGYAGTAHAPAKGTYSIDATTLEYTTVEDSGAYPSAAEGDIANLAPLVMAALNEVGFAWEAGPLTSWSN